MIFVSWHDAINYTKWLTANGHNGDRDYAYRLPTEAEWEYAARGNNSQTVNSYFWTGNSVPDAMQNNQKDAKHIPSGPGLPLGVARFAPNGFGLHDTIGNVEEWVHDYYGSSLRIL